MPDTVIIGGGISGLAAAYYLAKAGAKATLLESRPRLGGVIETVSQDGCTLEAGPDSFLSAKPAALELIEELGLAGQVIGSNDHLRVTFVRRNGKLVPLPDGLMMMVPTRILPLVTTRLIGWGTKVKMGMELFRAPKPHSEDQSVSEFIAEHYGAEAVEYLAEPLLSGVYGGDPDQLSVRSVLARFVELSAQYGSLTRGVLAERARAARPGSHNHPAPLFRTLRGGLGQLVAAVEAVIRGRIEIRQARAETVERSAAGFRVRVAGDWLEAGQVVIATEAHSGSALLAGLDARAAELLASVPYSSSLVAALGFDASEFERPPAGFGFLVPRKERRVLTACTWVGTKFAYRVPDGKIVARCFAGGPDKAALLARSDEDLLDTVTAELQEIAGFRAQPRFRRIFRWPRAMALYPVGHAARIAELESRVAAMPGLYLAGNAYQGIGVPDCIRMGKAAAGKILAG